MVSLHHVRGQACRDADGSLWVRGNNAHGTSSVARFDRQPVAGGALSGARWHHRAI